MPLARCVLDSVSGEPICRSCADEGRAFFGLPAEREELHQLIGAARTGDADIASLSRAAWLAERNDLPAVAVSALRGLVDRSMDLGLLWVATSSISELERLRSASAADFALRAQIREAREGRRRSPQMEAAIARLRQTLSEMPSDVGCRASLVDLLRVTREDEPALREERFRLASARIERLRRAGDSSGAWEVAGLLASRNDLRDAGLAVEGTRLCLSALRAELDRGRSTSCLPLLVRLSRIGGSEARVLLAIAYDDVHRQRRRDGGLLARLILASTTTAERHISLSKTLIKPLAQLIATVRSDRKMSAPGSALRCALCGEQAGPLFEKMGRGVCQSCLDFGLTPQLWRTLEARFHGGHHPVGMVSLSSALR